MMSFLSPGSLPQIRVRHLDIFEQNFSLILSFFSFYFYFQLSNSLLVHSIGKQEYTLVIIVVVVVAVSVPNGIVNIRTKRFFTCFIYIVLFLFFHSSVEDYRQRNLIPKEVCKMNSRETNLDRIVFSRQRRQTKFRKIYKNCEISLMFDVTINGGY